MFKKRHLKFPKDIYSLKRKEKAKKAGIRQMPGYPPSTSSQCGFQLLVSKSFA